MNPTRQQTNAVARFQCLGDRCPDTCCKGWGMQLTAETVNKYKREAPELLEAVTSGESEFIMKRDPVTDYCVKLENGWCGIHRDYGEAFLGDACNFYPRITRALETDVFTTAGLSCPETARLMLYSDDGFAPTPREEVRVPFSLKNYLPQGLLPEQAMAIHTLFVAEAGNAASSAERNLMRISTVARALETQPQDKWQDAAPFYFKMAEGRIPKAEAVAADYFNLLHALQGLLGVTKPSTRERLMLTITTMAEALGARLDWQKRAIELDTDAAQRSVVLINHWRTQAAQVMQPVLRKYLQAQLSQALFPFAGLGQTLSERVTIIGVRFATVKLALMAHAGTHKAVPNEEDTIRIVQSLSRFLDHLADPTLSLNIYRETGWIREPRLRALIGDE